VEPPVVGLHEEVRLVAQRGRRVHERALEAELSVVGRRPEREVLEAVLPLDAEKEFILTQIMIII
jgi:hypothetical protein